VYQKLLKSVHFRRLIQNIRGKRGGGRAAVVDRDAAADAVWTKNSRAPHTVYVRHWRLQLLLCLLAFCMKGANQATALMQVNYKEHTQQTYNIQFYHVKTPKNHVFQCLTTKQTTNALYKRVCSKRYFSF